MDNNLTISLSQLEKDLPELNKTLEKVYKDYAVDNETDYVFKTQISQESIEKIEISSLSKLSLEDIRLGRF